MWIKNDMHEELKLDNLEIYFQPQFDLETFNITGAEALVRFKGEDGQMRNPQEFIPQMEQDDTIPFLDIWVFNEVCKIQKKRRDNKKQMIPIAVNISMRTAAIPFNIYDLTMAVRSTGIQFKDVQVELTGTAPCPSTAGFKKSMDYLKEQGLKVVLDDFGIDYTTLSMFADVFFDCIKIDKYFLHRATDDLRKRAILKGIIQMAKDTQTDVICEGIESDIELELIRSYGCTKGQGYLFSKAVCLAEFEQMLEERPVLEYINDSK